MTTRRRRGPFLVLGAFVVALAVLALGQRLVATVVVPTASMEPGLQPGDRLVVNRLAGEPHRGDLVVFDGHESFGIDGALVKRVAGLPGDRVSCCTASGLVSVNGQPLTEPYLYPGDAPSLVPFDVIVPAGRMWVLGDHRSVSEDSRSYLGRPGGGFVREADILGQPAVRYWPPDRLGALGP